MILPKASHSSVEPERPLPSSPICWLPSQAVILFRFDLRK